jgi:hypothetical protein
MTSKVADEQHGTGKGPNSVRPCQFVSKMRLTFQKGRRSQVPGHLRSGEAKIIAQRSREEPDHHLDQQKAKGKIFFH